MAYLPSVSWKHLWGWWWWCTGRRPRTGMCRWGLPLYILAEMERKSDKKHWRDSNRNIVNAKTLKFSFYGKYLRANQITREEVKQEVIWLHSVTLKLTRTYMMIAATMTPTLCSRSPTTWMKAARTLVLPWLPSMWAWPWPKGLWPLSSILR